MSDSQTQSALVRHVAMKGDRDAVLLGYSRNPNWAAMSTPVTIAPCLAKRYYIAHAADLRICLPATSNQLQLFFSDMRP